MNRPMGLFLLGALGLGSCAKADAPPAPESFTYTLDGRTVTTTGTVVATTTSAGEDEVVVKNDWHEVRFGNQAYQEQVSVRFRKPVGAPQSAFAPSGVIAVDLVLGTTSVGVAFYTFTGTSALGSAADGWTGNASGVDPSGPGAVQVTFANVHN